MLNPEFHHLGLALEAVTKIVSFGFDTLSLHRIEARFMQGNTPSLHLMEKLGMSFEGYRRDSMLVKGSYRTIGTCAILQNEWLARDAKDARDAVCHFSFAKEK